MMNPDGTIRHMEPDSIQALRSYGKAYTDPKTPRAGALYRDIKGLDERVWQHLLDCAAAAPDMSDALRAILFQLTDTQGNDKVFGRDACITQARRAYMPRGHAINKRVES